MEPKRLERKLAAILYADVAGYSRLTGADEEGTHRTLSTYLDAITASIDRHNGKVMHFAGDAVLAEFASVVNALTCAVDIQRDLKARNQDLPEARRLQFRIGVNLGDVIVDRDEIYGDGVNVAARLESLAEPGGICISDVVRQSVEGKLDLAFEDLGEQSVKNIDKPVHAYRAQLKPGATLPTPIAKPQRPMRHVIAATVVAVVLLIGVGVITWLAPWAPTIEPASVQRMAFPLPEQPSIAVLPFANLSDDPNQEYFTDGITNDIITDLSKFGDLVVIAANSTFTYKGKPVKVQQVAEELGVRYVLEGSIQKAGNQVRINAQFIDTVTGEHLWAKRYAREFNDIFAVQDEITQKIVSTLGTWSGRVAKVNRERAKQKGTTDLNAYEYFLLGIEHKHRFTKEDSAKARELFEKAIELDPRYARAYATLAWMHFLEWLYGWTESQDLSAAQAYDLAKTAVELDDGEAEAHWILAEVYLFIRRQPEKAIAEFERALVLNPNHSDLLADWGGFAVPVLTGRADEGIRLVKKAMRLNPYHPDWYEQALGFAAYVARRYDEAVSAFRKVAHHSPESRVAFAASYAQLGRLEEARAEAAKLLELQPEFSIREWTERYYFRNPADLEHYINGLRKAGLPEEPPLPLPDKPSIAVLPFANMSDDPKQEYFVDGMTDDLITDLSKISGLFIIARNSTFAYKGKSPDVRQVSRELGVKYVLEGSVRRAGEQVRINAQLIDATTGGHIWAERYDGTLTNVFALQDEVTQKIVTALAVNLTSEEEAGRTRIETKNPKAYDAFLQGWEHYRRGTPEEFAKAISYFEQAIKWDPNYGRAHSALAAVYWNSTWNGWWAQSLGLTYTPAYEQTRLYQEKAMEAPSALTHQVASEIAAYYRRSPDKALAEAERAIALDANDPAGHLAMATALIKAGKPAEAAERVHTAMRLDPHYPASYLTRLSQAQFALGQFQDAASTLERAVSRNPDDGWTFVYLAAAYGHLGREAEAKTTVEKANVLRAKAGWGALTLLTVRHDLFKWVGDRKPLREGLRKAGIEAGADWVALVTTGPSGYEIKGATTIDLATTKALHDRGVPFVDVYKTWPLGRIPGTYFLELWTGEFNEVRLLEIVDKTQEVVIYSSERGGGERRRGANACAMAITWGFQKVYYFENGFLRWKDAGYPVEKSG